MRVSVYFLFCTWLVMAQVLCAQQVVTNAVATPPEEIKPIPIDHLIGQKGPSWQMGADEFMKKFRNLGFRWTSATSKTTARAYGLPFLYRDKPVFEVLARFRNEKLYEVVISLYNRGDAGEISKKDFAKMVNDAQNMLSDWSGARPVPVRYQLESGGVQKDARVWNAEESQAKLEWSYSTGGRKTGYSFRPEYISLQMHSSGSDLDYASSIQAKKKMEGAVSRTELKSRVKKDSNGDVYISGIPMVDQGQKGYCVVATMERIMRYYGRDVDQHEMAQLAQTDSGGGTSVEQMIDALRRLSLNLGCKVNIYEEWNWKDYQRMIGKYNREADDTGEPIIVIPTEGTIYISELDAQLKPNPWLAARMSKSADFGKFKSRIEEYVNKGIPLPWSVYTGVFPEKPEIKETGRGNHMRMIIGYNNKTDEILYSDSWGKGHEKKRLSSEHAWTMTHGLYTVEPLRMKY